MIQNLLSDDSDHIEALFRRDGVDDYIAVYADEVFRVENAVFILLPSLALDLVTNVSFPAIVPRRCSLGPC